MQRTTLGTLRNSFLVLAGIVAVSYLSYSSSRETGLENLRNDAQRRLRAVSTALFTPADKYSYLPEVVSSHPLMLQALEKPDNPHHIHEANVFLEHLNAGAGTADIYLLDSRGLAIASSNWGKIQTFIGQNYAFRPYFQDALKTDKGKFYAMGNISLKPGYYISHAVNDTGGVTIGVAVVKVDMSGIDAAWDTDRTVVTVTDKNGVAFLSSQKDWKYRPIWPLGPEAEKELKQTRQYDGVLQPALQTRLRKRLSHDEALLDVSLAKGEPAVPYMMRSGTLEGSGWQINIFMPMEPVHVTAIRIAVLTGGALTLLVLAMMYIMQTRSRIRERDQSQNELEEAHQALERKHHELEALSENLRLSSITDSLTGAHNRRHFLESANKLASLAERHRHPLTIMMIDVDHFKRINDRYGHPVGDRVLQTLTALCLASLREGDVFARFGGEEFIVALPNTDEAAARQVAERLRAEVMAHPIMIKDEALTVTVSCGIARFLPEESGIDDTIKRADEALYMAKGGGRNRVITL